MEMDFACMPKDTLYVLATVYGYMCYPNPKDIDKRDCFIAQYIIKNYHEFLESVPIDYARKALNFYDEKLGLRNANNAEVLLHIKEGCLAGAMYITLLEMKAGGGQQPSVNKAKFLTYEIYSKRAISEHGVKIEVTDAEKVGRAWNRYKWVAPMWASTLLIADGVLSLTNVKDNPSLFFGLINCLNSKSKDLNLKFECWKFPNGHDFPKIELETVGLSALNREKLPKYDYKNRY